MTMQNDGKDSDNPWDYIQPYDIERFGEEVLDREQQALWCAAVALAGSLPYMWRKKAKVIRELIYDKLEVGAGDKVLVIGEAVDNCGFTEDLNELVGPDGEVKVFEIIEEARDKTMARVRGRSGRIGSWRWEYTRDIADDAFDCVAVLQAVQHCDDWNETGSELLRVMKPGRRILLTEITLGEPFRRKIETDIHFESIFDRLAAGMDVHLGDLSNYSPEELLEAFDGLVEQPETFTWKGIENFWGRKPLRA